MKKIFLFLLLVCLCQWPLESKAAEGEQANAIKIEKMFSEYQMEFPDVPVMTVKGLLGLGDSRFILVDVRTPAEQKISIIPGAMTRVDFEKKEDRYGDFKIIVYCTIGYRSGLYSAKLRTKGFDAYNLKGGVLAWAGFHRKFQDPSGNETKKVHVYGPKWNLLPKDYDPVW